MKDLLFKSGLIIISITFFWLFAQNKLIAQPSPMGQPSQMQGSPAQQLQEFALPEGPVSEKDITGIKDVMQQVLTRIRENLQSSGQSGGDSDTPEFISGIQIFRDWLNNQECVDKVNISYVKPSGEYLDTIFHSYPGQIPINIFFKTGPEQTAKYRLMVYVSDVKIIEFASFIKDNTGIIK